MIDLKKHSFFRFMALLGLSVSLWLVPEKVQSQTNSEILFNKYKNEIGIDIQNLFSTLGNSGELLSARLVYKHRKPEKGLIAVNEKTAYRYQFFLSGDQEIGERNVDTLVNTLLNILQDDLDRIGIGASVGLEREIQRGRFQYFYGVDLGYNYSNSEIFNYYRTTSIPSGKVTEYLGISKTISHGPSLVGLFGFKFFLVPEISLSIESGLSTVYAFVNVDEMENNLTSGEIETTGKFTYQEISFYFDFLRALNLSYYF